MRPVPIGMLLRLEWRGLMATPSPWLIAALAIVLQAVALMNGAANARKRHAAFEEARSQQQGTYAAARKDVAAIETRRLAEGIPLTRLRNRFPSVASVQARLVNFRAALPSLPTAFLSNGMADALPQRYAYRSGERFSPFTRTAGTRVIGGLFPERQTENPTSLLNGSFDLSFVSVYIWPILVLALTCNVVSADREAGVLALVLAQPISFRQWLLARMTVRAGFALCLGVALPAAAMLAMMGTSGSSDSLVRLGIWAIAAGGYTLFWLSVGLLASVRSQSAAMSLVVAMSAWLLLVVIVPAVANLARSLVPVDPTVFADAERAASLSVNPRIDTAVAALNRLVRSRFSSRPAERDQDDLAFTEPLELSESAQLVGSLRAIQPRWAERMPVSQLSRAIGEARRILIEQELAPVLSSVSAQEQRLESLTAAAQFCSPALLFQAVADSVAGTDAVRWKQFLGQLDEYLRDREEFFTEKTLNNENVYSKDFDHLTAFSFREETTRGVAERLGLPLVGLLAMTGFLGTACLRTRCATQL